jgi:two-component system sensor histidine kinase CiaH
LFTILGAVTMLAVDSFFFRGAKQELIEEAERLAASHYILKERPVNYRKIVVFFDSEGRLIGGEVEDFVPKRINVRNVNMIRTEKFPVKGLNNEIHNYLTLLKRTNDTNPQYMKIYVNVDGEVSARDTVIKVYTICALAILLLSVAASYLLSNKSIKPIITSLEKQLNFVSDASHELRTPLAIVQSKIENILTDSQKTVYDVSEDLAISLKELNRLTKLTKDLLVLARNDNETITLELEVVNLDELIKAASEPYVELAELQNKTFTYVGGPINIKVDRNKIYQVLLILLDNAFIYTNEGDGVKIKLAEENNEVIIEVSDTGIGISDYTKEHIFERFYREDKARSRATGGNGLGLSIAKTLISLHKGKIIVNHNQPKGTKFTIVLPKGKLKE